MAASICLGAASIATEKGLGALRGGFCQRVANRSPWACARSCGCSGGPCCAVGLEPGGSSQLQKNKRNGRAGAMTQMGPQLHEREGSDRAGGMTEKWAATVPAA
jgi:hypothetical protein